MAGVMGRLLVLSWAMPPLVYPRSIQIARTLKELARRGWSITVVTVQPEADPHSVKDHALEAFYSAHYRRLTVETREEVAASPRWLRCWRRRFAPQDLNSANWAWRAKNLLLAELPRGDYDALVTFAQPWVDHEVGLAVKRRKPQVPWFAHFSDPWADSPYLRFENDEDRIEILAKERKIIGSADGVAFVTRETADMVMAKYPADWREKVSVVAHGYDRSLLRLVPPIPREARTMRIVHTGSFYPGMREPGGFIDALAEFAKNTEARANVRVEFVGYASNECVDHIGSLGLGDMVTFAGKQSYLDCLAVMKRADLLLLIDAPTEHSIFLPSKIADYLMVGKPILGLTPLSGASADLLRRMRYPVVAPVDSAAIARELEAAYVRWRSGTLHPDDGQIEAASELDIRTTTNVFEQALNAAIAASRAKPRHSIFRFRRRSMAGRPAIFPEG